MVKAATQRSTGGATSARSLKAVRTRPRDSHRDRQRIRWPDQSSFGPMLSHAVAYSRSTVARPKWFTAMMKVPLCA